MSLWAKDLCQFADKKHFFLSLNFWAVQVELTPAVPQRVRTLQDLNVEKEGTKLTTTKLHARESCKSVQYFHVCC